VLIKGKKVMRFKWKKNGKIFDPRSFPNIPWLKVYAQAPATLEYTSHVRVFFSCRPEPDASGQYTSNTAWVDLKKSDLSSVERLASKPVLELGSLGEFDEFGIYPASAIRYEKEVFLYYAGWTRCDSVPFNVAIGLAKSLDDGDSFHKIGRGPILAATQNEPFIIGGPKIRRFGNLFYLFYIGGTEWLLDDGFPEPVYRIRVATSTDGEQWQRSGNNLIAPVLGDEEAQASPDVFEWEGQYHMFFCYRHGRNFRNAARGYRIGYACSEDLVTWHRDDTRSGITPSEYGWDSESISYPHVFKSGNSINMLYLGNNVGRDGFGLATLLETTP
jgi:predicted GH43/DUF377 family glycosyl hydrolase